MAHKSNTVLIINNIKNILIKWGFTKKGLITNSKGEWYLAIQLLIISSHILPGWLILKFIHNPWNYYLLIAGLILSLRGLIITIKALHDLGDNLSPLPYPIKKSILIRTNSYKKSRHPIYTGLLFISLGICISSASLLHLFLFILLAIVLRKKAKKEEEKLISIHPEYKNYIKEVPAIINNIKYLDWRN